MSRIRFQMIQKFFVGTGTVPIVKYKSVRWKSLSINLDPDPNKNVSDPSYTVIDDESCGYVCRQQERGSSPLEPGPGGG